MRIKKVIVVYKKSAYQVYARERRNPHFLKLIRDSHPVARRFIPSHQIHEDSLKQVREILKKRGISIFLVYRARVFEEKGVDLILTVGGDGTFLDASHKVFHCPILGLNSSPQDSVGLFCGTTVDQLGETLDAIKMDQVSIIEMARLKVLIGHEPISVPVLNDVLISQTNPAATSRFIISWKGKEEEQKSSGIWVAPAAGSTAAIRGAGGKLLPIRSQQFQFVVREPFLVPGKKCFLTKGILKSNEKLVVYSKMRSGGVYVDGPYGFQPVRVGEKIVISANAPKLCVLAFNQKRRSQF